MLHLTAPYWRRQRRGFSSFCDGGPRCQNQKRVVDRTRPLGQAPDLPSSGPSVLFSTVPTNYQEMTKLKRPLTKRLILPLASALITALLLAATPALADSTTGSDPAKDVTIRTDLGTDAFPSYKKYLDIRKVKVTNAKKKVTVRVSFRYLSKANRKSTTLSLQATGRTGAGAKEVSIGYSDVWGTADYTSWSKIPFTVKTKYGKNGYVQWSFNSKHVGKAKKVRATNVVSMVTIKGGGNTYYVSDGAKPTKWAKRG